MEKTFEVTSGVIVCSDPCYTIPTWCQGVVENVKKGTWIAEVEKTDSGSWGDRIATLTIVNKDSLDKDITLSNRVEEMYSTEPLNFGAGVDSGQFGFFDKDFYRNDESAKDLKKYGFGDDFETKSGDSWYRACCDLTLDKEQWGVLPNGAVSSSGFGDGSYDVFGIKNDEGEYVAFSVVFIWNDEDEEEEWDEEDEWDEEYEEDEE
jgi:hypothetical protein